MYVYLSFSCFFMKEILQQAKKHSLSDAQIYVVNTAVNLWSQFHEEVPRKDKKKHMSIVLTQISDKENLFKKKKKIKGRLNYFKY